MIERNQITSCKEVTTGGSLLLETRLGLSNVLVKILECYVSNVQSLTNLVGIIDDNRNCRKAECT